MKRALCLLLTITVLSLTGCSNASETEDTDASNNEISLTIMAAASLQKSFDEIADQFSAEHPNITIDFNYAGSSSLVQNLEAGAPADVFASAEIGRASCRERVHLKELPSAMRRCRVK